MKETEGWRCFLFLSSLLGAFLLGINHFCLISHVAVPRRQAGRLWVSDIPQSSTSQQISEWGWFIGSLSELRYIRRNLLVTSVVHSNNIHCSSDKAGSYCLDGLARKDRVHNTGFWSRTRRTLSRLCYPVTAFVIGKFQDVSTAQSISQSVRPSVSQPVTWSVD